MQLEISRMGEINKINSRFVEVNVGGKLFTTALQTLCAFPGSFIESMFSGRHPQSVDGSGFCFIDRSPVVFEFVLNFLRTGVLVEPDSMDMRRRFRLDLDYYGLTDFAFGANYPGFQGSSTLSPIDKRLLCGWTDNIEKGGKPWRLIYKGSRDSFSADEFHKHCNGNGRTLTVITDQNGWVFGGFAAVPWGSGAGPKRDPDAWLFSLKQMIDGPYVPEKLEPTGCESQTALYHHAGFGACFGGVGGLCVSNNCNQNFISSSIIPPGFRNQLSGVRVCFELSLVSAHYIMYA